MLRALAGVTVDDSPSDENRSDEDLIRQIRSGDKEKYRILVTRHREMIVSLLFRQTGNHVVAADIAQDAFVKAYLGLKSFRSASKFSSWLVRIALNAANSHFSSKAFKQQLLNESFQVEKHDMSTGTNEGEDMAGRKLQCFQRALPLLNQKFRDVLTLCALEGKSYEEAAIILEIPVGTVRSRLNSARLKLKDAISAEIERSSGDES